MARKVSAEHKHLRSVWRDMLRRCYNPERNDYARYGAKGITVCKRWFKFENFLEDMSFTYEKGLTLDRIDNKSNYKPSNCRWATPSEQMRNYSRNRYLTLNGVTQTIADWSEQIGVRSNTIRQRLDYYGWSVERALTWKRG